MLKQIKVTQREGQCMQFKLQNGYRIMIIYSSESFNKLIMILTWFKKLVSRHLSSWLVKIFTYLLKCSKFYLVLLLKSNLIMYLTDVTDDIFFFSKQVSKAKVSTYIIQNWKSSQLSNAWFFLSRNSKNSMILFSFLFFSYLRTKILT